MKNTVNIILFSFLSLFYTTSIKRVLTIIGVVIYEEANCQVKGVASFGTCGLDSSAIVWLNGLGLSPCAAPYAIKINNDFSSMIVNIPSIKLLSTDSNHISTISPLYLLWVDKSGNLRSTYKDSLSIPYSKITNVPIISGATGTYGSVVTSNGIVSSGKRVETYSGNTDASGNYTIVFGTAYVVAPNLQINVISTSANIYTKTIVSTTGFTINIFQRGILTVPLVGDVLAGNTSVVVGITVDVLITEK